MPFKTKPGFIVFCDGRPASSVAMRTSRGESLPFNGGASYFSDAESRYEWAFEYAGEIKEGDTFVFTSLDRVVTGKPGPLKIYVGAGCDAPIYVKDGWTCNDIAEAAAVWPNIELVGPAWSLGVPDASTDEILAKGMIEHLTYHEFIKALAEWKRVLRPGGFFTGEVPDVDEYLREYLKMRAGQARGETFGEGSDAGAEGEPPDHEAMTGIDRWLRRVLWGWQRWPGDEHRSGWTEPLLRWYLKTYFGGRFDVRRHAINYEKDVPESRVRHLWFRAWKS